MSTLSLATRATTGRILWPVVAAKAGGGQRVRTVCPVPPAGAPSQMKLHRSAQ